MKHMNFTNTTFRSSEIAYGCMRISDMNDKDLDNLLNTALDEDINFFDHADIYGGGKSEEVFGEFMKRNHIHREDIILQSKCGIRDGYYDFSKKHIITAVDGILKRLQTDYLDILLLHRPDPLMEVDKVAEALDSLYQSGKVHHFGVSNQNPYQMELLSSVVDQPLIINQIQFGPAHTEIIDAGIYVNMGANNANSGNGILEYCQLHNMMVQAWSPFGSTNHGIFLDNENYRELNDCLDTLAKIKGVSKEAVAIAWILRHPARIQPIVGTTNVQRLKSICDSSRVDLTREEWYEIYTAAGHKIP